MNNNKSNIAFFRCCGRRLLVASMLLALVACGGSSSSSSGASSGGGSGSGLSEWPQSQPGEDPPPAPEEFAPIITNLSALSEALPRDVATRLFDPVAFGYTINDISDPVVVEHMVRASIAQGQDGSRLEHAYHWYGHPEENANVALVPVEFNNRYGTRLHGEIVLPRQGQVSPAAGPFPVIVALQGLNTNTAMYRWWHRLFADAGYVVFAFDFSGQGRSDDAGESDPDSNLHDAQDAIAYLFGASPVASVLDADRLGVIGHSMGAAAALRVQEQEAEDAAEPNPVRVRAVVAAAPVFESVSASPVPVMIQTGDHDGPIAPLPFVNPAVVRPLFDALSGDRAFIVAEAASHAQHTNYPLLPSSTWGREIAASYSLAWMNYYLKADALAMFTLFSGHPHLSYLHDSVVRVGNQEQVFRGNGLAPSEGEF